MSQILLRFANEVRDLNLNSTLSRLLHSSKLLLDDNYTSVSRGTVRETLNRNIRELHLEELLSKAFFSSGK